MLQGPLPVTAPLVLNPLMAKLAEAAGFPAGYLGGGATGYQKVALEANLNLTEMCQEALDIRAVSSLPLILDAACGYGDPMHLHRTIGMSEAAGFAAIELEDQLVPKRAHHHIGIEHMIPMELMAAKVAEAVAARRNRDFVIIARTHAMRATDMDDALRGGLAGLGMTLEDLGRLGYRIVADPLTPLLAAYTAWKKVYADLTNGFGATTKTKPDWSPIEQDMLAVIDLERLLAVERATVEPRRGGVSP